MFPLAHLAHVTPEQAARLTLARYANLIDSIDTYLAAARKGQ